MTANQPIVARASALASWAPVLLPALAFLAALAYLFGVVGTRSYGDGYYWSRWTDPPAIMLSAVAGLGFAAALGWLVSPGRDATGAAQRAGRRALGLAALAVLILAAPAWQRAYADRRRHLAWDSRAIARINVQAGLWIREHIPAGAVVGVNDAGAIRYFGGHQTLDLVGLNWADIAFRRITLRGAIDRTDWLAIFPSWLDAVPEWLDIGMAFQERAVFEVSPETYTICPQFPEQARKVVYQRVAPPAATTRH